MPDELELPATITVDAKGYTLTPQFSRLALNKIRAGLRRENISPGAYSWTCNVDVQAAWENCGVVVSQSTGEPCVGQCGSLGGIRLGIDLRQPLGILSLWGPNGLEAQVINIAIPTGYEEFLPIKDSTCR